MRIVLVSREMAPFWGAGIGTYVSSMARAWAGAGHEVHILGVNDAETASKGPRLFPGIRFHEVDPLSETDDRLLWRSEVAKRSQQVRRALIRLHAAHRFDYIEFPEYFAEGALSIRGARALGELAGATLGVRLHSPDRLCRALNADPILGFNRLLTDRLEMESIATADVVISPTASLLDWCRDEIRAHGIPLRGHACVVPYPFDAAEFAEPAGAWADPASGRAGHRVPEILYFGRLERRKGVDILIDAFDALLSRGIDCTLRLVGSDTKTGPGNASMREHLVLRLSAAARDRVTFEDRRPRTELVSTILGARASGGFCCFPSRWENFPNVLLEAMAIGAPVVCSDAGGMAEIVQHGHSGLLVKSCDADALADAFLLTLTDRSLRERMAQNAPAQVRALCDPAIIVAKSIEAIERGRSHRAARALPSIESHPRSVPEVVIDAPGAWRELQRVLTARESDHVLVRSQTTTLDPRFAAAAVRILLASPDVAAVTAFVLAPGARESWLPMGLDRAALAAADLSGLGAGAVVRCEAIASVMSAMEDGIGSLGPASGPQALAWILGAALASRRWEGVAIPEPWILTRSLDQPYAIAPPQNRVRVSAASMIERAGALGPDAARLLASVLPPSGA